MLYTCNLPTPGTCDIHLWYQNRITLCGGDVRFKIDVQAPPIIAGSTLFCAGSMPYPFTLKFRCGSQLGTLRPR
jgi:hypothetical protein